MRVFLSAFSLALVIATPVALAQMQPYGSGKGSSSAPGYSSPGPMQPYGTPRGGGATPPSGQGYGSRHGQNYPQGGYGSRWGQNYPQGGYGSRWGQNYPSPGYQGYRR